MFGGGGVNPRQLEQMMEQMGIDVDELDAIEVRIQTESGETLVFDAPEVTQMNAQGQTTYQIVGDPETVSAAELESGTDTSSGGEAIPESDIELVAERTGASSDDARAALEAADGDLAAAIASLE